MAYTVFPALVTLDERVTLFLIITNVFLGLIVLTLCLIVARKTFRELRFRRKARSMLVSSVGLTLPDGGERLDAQRKLVVTAAGSIEREERTDKRPA